MFETKQQYWDFIEGVPKTQEIDRFVKAIDKVEIKEILIIPATDVNSRFHDRVFHGETIRINLVSGQWILITDPKGADCCEDKGWTSVDDVGGLNGEIFRTIEIKENTRTMSREEQIQAQLDEGNYTREEILDEGITYHNKEVVELFIDICSDKDSLSLTYYNHHNGCYSSMPVRIHLFDKDDVLVMYFDQEDDFDFDYLENHE